MVGDMEKIVREIKYWSQLFLLPVYALSFLMPRSKNIWVFGSTFGKRFADNPKYFYLYVSQFHSNEIIPIWISKNKKVIKLLKSNDLKAYYLYSLKGIWYALKAKNYIFDNYSKDICFVLSGGAIKINLWHGIPLKKIQMDNIFDKVRHPENNWQKIRWMLRRLSDEKPTDYVLATSMMLKKVFSSAFHTKNVLICGYPRNIVFKNNVLNKIGFVCEKECLSFMTNFKEKNNGYVALYMPTFRDSEIQIIEVIDFNRFGSFLSENNILFCVKTHPKSKTQNLWKSLQCSNIKVMPQETDPYYFITAADVLITDYSSIYFDYLLLDRPIIFFDYDRDEYLKASREFYFNYEEFTPGIKVDNMAKLMYVLSDFNSLYSDVQMKIKRELVRSKVFQNSSVNFCEELYGIIKLLTSNNK